MTLLGVDTGGTFTDAVLVDVVLANDALANAVLVNDVPNGAISLLASAKSPTTRDDLSIGIGLAIDQVLGEHLADQIELVSLSTTLATNAIVEGQGRRVALIAVGFGAGELARFGLDEALDGDPAITIAGGHDAMGVEHQALDLEALAAGLDEIRASGADAVAVVAQFGVRNPAHELQVAAVVREQLGLPVTASHELTARLNGPLRAVTCVLNARLIGIIGDLLDATETILADRGIDAPIMVVRGDGSLVSVDFARDRPIETILSGPAASVVGAAHLTELDRAIVSDIGGTTTDIAVLANGRPSLDPEGAKVGGFQTMVEAVAISTAGLGGDSQVHIDESADPVALTLGPRRVIPISMFAVTHPDLVHQTLDRRLARDRVSDLDGQFVILVRDRDTQSETGPAAEIVAALAEGPKPLVDVAATRRHELAVDRLVRRGVIRIAGLTPTDASQALLEKQLLENQLLDTEPLGTELVAAGVCDVAAAVKALTLVARRKNRHGGPIVADGHQLALRIVDSLVEDSARLVLQAALTADGFDPASFGHNPTGHPIIAAGLDGPADDRHVSLATALSTTLVGLGASASTYYPHVARRLHAPLVVPEHAGVANALGAVVGRVSMRSSVVITPLKKGRFRVMGVGDADLLPEAEQMATEAVSVRARASAVSQGVDDPTVSVERAEVSAEVAGTVMVVEVRITATASGRPRIGER